MQRRNGRGNGGGRAMASFHVPGILNQFGLQGLKDTIDQPLWSRKTIPAAATTEVEFFDATGHKAVTSITTPSRLPGDNYFVCMGVRFDVAELGDDQATLTTPVDLAKIRQGYVKVLVDDDKVWETLLRDCPGGSGQGGFASHDANAAATNTVVVSNGVADRRAFRGLLKPFIIRSNKEFKVVVQWEGAGITLANATRVYCILDGVYARDIAPAR